MASKFLNLSTDTTLGGNAPSDELAVSQKAIKTYVDSHSGGGGSYTAGDGIDIDTSVAISDLTNPEKNVVTANLIADAIAAAIQSITIEIEARLHAIEERIDFGPGEDGELLMSDGNKISRSGVTIGGSELPDASGSPDVLTTEEAVVAALSWRLD